MVSAASEHGQKLRKEDSNESQHAGQVKNFNSNTLNYISAVPECYKLYIVCISKYSSRLLN